MPDIHFDGRPVHPPMMTPENPLPMGSDSNLLQVLLNPKPISGDQVSSVDDLSKPVVLIMNCDEVQSHCLIDALVHHGAYDVFVVAPNSWKTMFGVSAEEAPYQWACKSSGTPVDCVQFALSGELFSLSKLLLVISVGSKVSSCVHQRFGSSDIDKATKALFNGSPSVSISLNWLKDENVESRFKDAMTVCLPMLTETVRNIEKGKLPKPCLLHIEVPGATLPNKGIPIPKRSSWRRWLCCQASSGEMTQAAMGQQFVQLSRDDSNAGAAGRFSAQKKDV